MADQDQNRAPAAAPSPMAPDRPAGAFAPLRHPVFRAVWVASLLSNFGSQMQAVGASWLMAQLTPDAGTVALVQAAATLPIVLLSLPSGAIADGLDRRLVMLASQWFMLAAAVALAALAWAGLATPALLLLFTFLVGCGTALNGPAWQASVGEMVPRADLPAAVALNSMGFNLARSLGPALGGAVVAALSAATAFAANALSFVALIAVLLRWHPQRPGSTLPREALGPAILGGLRYVVLSPGILRVLGRGLVFGLGAVSATALLPVVARDALGGGALTYGLLLGAFGAGAVGGALASAPLRARLSAEALVRWACGAFALALLAVAASRSLPLSLVALVPAGAAWVLALSSFNVGVQMSTPRWVVARALSLYQMATFGGMAAGSWLWGSLAEGAGLPVALALAAGVLGACLLLGLAMPLSDPMDRDLGPLDRWRAPDTAVPVDARTGPVVVAVEWRVAPSDLPAFLALMAERRRARRRDGARDWHLLRDLADPELWVERYRTATWADYQRLNNRLTREDGALFERLRALNRGAARPVVRRMIEREPRLPGQDAAREAADAARAIAAPLTDPSRVA